MSGSTIGGVLGAVIGFVVGGPAGSQWGFMLGSVAGGVLMPPEMEGPRLSDLRPQGSEYGRPIPIVFGTAAVGGNVIWQTDLVEVKSESGGKGGPEVTQYTYFANFAVLLCEGEVQLGRIWAGPEKRLIWDGGALEGGTITFYNGSATQLPDPLMESHLGVGNVPAYRGYAYVVFEMFPVANDGNRIPFLTVEVGQVEASLANTNVGAYMSKVIVTDLYYAIFYWGGLQGVVIRRLSNDTIYKHYRFTSPGPVGNWFWDEDRQVFVINATAHGLVYYTMPITTGVWTAHDISQAIGTEPNPSSSVVAGVYQNGKYVFAASGAGAPYPTLYIMDPDTHDPIATYTYSGLADFASILAPASPTDNWVFVETTTSPTPELLRLELTYGATPIDLGTPANVTWSGIRAQVDPNTGYIWTWFQPLTGGGGTYLTVVVIDPAGAVLYSDTIDAATANIAANNIVFVPGSPNLAIFVGTRWLAVDRYSTFNADTPAYIGSADGVYHGTAYPELAIYNPTRDNLEVFRRDGAASETADGSHDLTTMAMPFWYLGGAATGGLEAQGELLSTIVSNLCVRAGLTVDEIDVTDLEADTVDGYVVAQQTTVRGAIQVLQPAYYFDAVESNGVIKFVKRGGASVVTIPDEDLGAYPSGSEPDKDLLLVRRGMEDELPSVLTVKYINRGTKYEVATKQSRRLIGGSGDEQSIDLPIVMTDALGQAVSDVNLHKAWVGRKTFAFNLPLKYAYLEPTDVITIRGQKMMMTKASRSGGILKCEGVFDDFNYAAYVVVTETSTSTGAGGTVFTPSDTHCELMNLVALRDVDHDAGFYAAACGVVPANWRGAVLYQSKDGGATYYIVGTFKVSAVMGVTTDALAPYAGGDAIDTVSTVNIQMVDGNLFSTTEDGFLGGVNIAAVGNEIIYYRYATLETDGSYTLNRLLRGRKGSTAQIGVHAVGDRFVFLATSTVIRVVMEPSDIGQSYLYKAVSVGSTLADTTAFAFIDTGAAYDPLAPVDVTQPATLYGRDPTTTTGLIWGYYGGAKLKSDGTIVLIPAGTVTLTDNATNYIYAQDDGTVVVTTVAPTGWPAPLADNDTALYEVVVADGVVVSYIDYRHSGGGGSGTPGSTSPLTTKGDLWGFSTTDDRIPVGTDGQQLVADSTQALGVKWVDEPFDVLSFYPGIPTAAAVLTRVPLARAVTFPANFAGAYGKASVASTGTAAFDVQKNGVSCGTITYTTSATATFASSGGTAVSLAAGDVLSIVAPGSADATLSDVGIVLAGVR